MYVLHFPFNVDSRLFKVALAWQTFSEAGFDSFSVLVAGGSVGVVDDCMLTSVGLDTLPIMLLAAHFTFWFSLSVCMQTLRNANARQSSVLLALQRMEMFMLLLEHISLNRRDREVVTGKTMHVKFFTIQ
jgi:hypothetical protein